MKRPLLLSAALIAAANLAACRLTGDLERPGPLWGDPPPPTVSIRPVSLSTKRSPGSAGMVTGR